MDIHVWPPLSELHSFDPECLAATALARKTNIRVVPSGNIHVSPDKRLPCLVFGTDRISGYANIVHFLESTGTIKKTNQDAFLAYLVHLNALTAWTLFEGPNYEKITRPKLSQAVPFPMQYNLAAQLRRNANDLCKRQGLVRDKRKQKDKGLTKLHSRLVKEQENKETLLRTTHATMSAVTSASHAYETVALALGDFDEFTPATLLLAANLFLQTHSVLPEKPLRLVIDKFPLLALVESKFETVVESLEGVYDYEASPELKYNLENVLWSYTPWSAWSVWSWS